MNKGAYHKIDLASAVAPVREIGIVLAKDASDASLSIVKARESDYEPKEREYVYEPLRIAQENIDVKALTLKFSVPESWYEETGAEPSSTVLKMMGSDRKWHSIRTSLMHKIVDRYEFVAVVPGAALFAIVAAAPAQLYRTQHHYK